MKHIIITGTSRGIGFEMAKQFAEAGHQVLALSRNIDPIKELNQPNISCFPFDITQKEDLLKTSEFVVKQWAKKVDILINNSGSLVNKPFEETTLNDFQEVYAVNVFGVVGLIQAVLPFMNSRSHVVNISSMGGIQGSMKFSGLSAYSSSKGALITLTEMLAEEYKEQGPSFNVLALGAVQTQMLEDAFPGFKAPISASDMANYIVDFSLKAHLYHNGKVIQVSSTTP